MDGYVISPSAVWMNSKTNKWLRKIDLEMERRVDKNFKYSDFKRYVTCNYCVPDVRFLNSEKTSIKSYEDNVLYIRDE